MEQLSIFNYLSINDEEEQKIKIAEVIQKVKDYDNKLKVLAVYLPDKNTVDEPAFAVDHDGKYWLGHFWHGQLKMGTIGFPLNYRDDLPNKHWIKLEELS